ncbi:MAG: hypothetical protein CVU43_21525 [Chloroflexi bacterium HGW-Chloroflexi-5]|jgi:hypothetical protein|nr:MAG: hypothetical protein CVU43_21525 [Chloroflexi bacterium HGW-Chloroflexi-5]
MQTIESIKIRVRQMLNDEEGARYSDLMLENAIRQAMGRLDDHLPLMRKLEHVITSEGREVTLTGLLKPLFLIQVDVLPSGSNGPIREVKNGYDYSLQGSTCLLDFKASYRPHEGETLRVTYAAQQLLSGLDGAVESTLPESALAAVESSAVSFAYMLRAASLSGVYGTKTGESAQLAEQSKVWKELAEAALSKLRSFQPFEYPEGFAFDQWDRPGG